MSPEVLVPQSTANRKPRVNTQIKLVNILKNEDTITLLFGRIHGVHGQLQGFLLFRLFIFEDLAFPFFFSQVNPLCYKRIAPLTLFLCFS